MRKFLKSILDEEDEQRLDPNAYTFDIGEIKKEREAEREYRDLMLGSKLGCFVGIPIALVISYLIANWLDWGWVFFVISGVTIISVIGARFKAFLLRNRWGFDKKIMD